MVFIAYRHRVSKLIEGFAAFIRSRKVIAWSTVYERIGFQTGV